MPHGEKLGGPRVDAARPDFDPALRGYDKRQVDQYVARVDGLMSTLVTERDQAHGHIQYLTAQLEQAQEELTELRQRPPQVDRASFRDLGPTVDQILALAEHQAQTITATAAQRAADQEAEAERVLAEARQRADQLRADSEAAHEQVEQEAQRISQESAQRVEDARAEADRLVQEARGQADQELEAARTQTQQEVEVRQQALTELHSELESARDHLDQTQRDAATAEQELAQLRQRAGEVGEDLAAELQRLDEARQAAEAAEKHAEKVRARVKREAERVAQLAASAVMAAAARGGETGEYPIVVPVRSRAPEDAGSADAGAAAVPDWDTSELAQLAAAEAVTQAVAGGPADGEAVTAPEAAEGIEDSVATPDTDDVVAPVTGERADAEPPATRPAGHADRQPSAVHQADHTDHQLVTGPVSRADRTDAQPNYLGLSEPEPEPEPQPSEQHDHTRPQSQSVGYLGLMSPDSPDDQPADHAQPSPAGNGDLRSAPAGQTDDAQRGAPVDGEPRGARVDEAPPGGQVDDAAPGGHGEHSRQEPEPVLRGDYGPPPTADHVVPGQRAPEPEELPTRADRP